MNSVGWRYYASDKVEAAFNELEAKAFRLFGFVTHP
jgi:hypothetical protein